MKAFIIVAGLVCGIWFYFLIEEFSHSFATDKHTSSIKVNVICIEGYEYIQNLITGYASGVVYTQSFINTDEGLRAKVCRDAGEQQ